MQEIWEDINGYEGLYQVSNLGRVKSLDRFIFLVNQNGRIKRKLKGRILKGGISSRGYQTIGLGIGNTKIIHRLVAEAFIPNPENKPQINHIDGNKLNNCVDNLEWCTNQENMQHAHKTGLFSYLGREGERNNFSKLTKESVLDIRKRRSRGEKINKIAQIYNISESNVCSICAGKTWTHLPI